MEAENLIYGNHSCTEYLKKSYGNINRILIARESARRYAVAITMAREYGIRLDMVTKQILDRVVKGANHQGIAMYISPYVYYDTSELLESASSNPLFVLLDGVEDPQNLGTIIRTSAAAGVDGIILENRRCAPITSTVMRVSSGGLSSVKIARINNLKNLFVDLNKRNISIVATMSEGKYLWTEVDYTNGAALIFGSEGEGVRRILAEKSDFTIRIPVINEMNSLNVSMAVGIIIYEALRQKRARA
jgi:23S rRNA (guanosine2251-2'-O)-methyltransferase